MGGVHRNRDIFLRSRCESACFLERRRGPSRTLGEMMARAPSRISQCQRTHAPMEVRIMHVESRFDVGRDCTQSGGSIVRSKILLVGLVLTPAALVATGYSSLGEAKGDDCKAKPDSASPAGLHWYYRVDRANNRHCWYLHEQGMPVHSLSHATTRNPDTQPDTQDDVAPQNGTADERVWPTPPIIDTPQPHYEQSATPAESPDANFTARWVDLPKSVDLNTHELTTSSNGYAAEQSAESGQGQLPPALAGVSAVNGDARENVGSQANFGSLSLVGAAVLALLLMSEALIRLVRASGWSLLRRRVRLESAHYGEVPAAALDATLDRHRRATTGTEPIVREEHTEAGELRGLLQRAGAGLRPPRSFAPSRPARRGEHANQARAHSAFERLKSRTFSGMTWAPL